MEKLSERDLRGLLAAVEILGSDVDYETFPRRVMDAVTRVVDVDLISYNEIDLAGGRHRFLLKPDPAQMIPGSAVHTAFVRRFGGHPMVARSLITAGTSDARLEQVVNRLRLLGMVGNCCGQGELRLTLGLSIAGNRTRRIGVALNRSLRDFDDIDGARVEALAPHIRSAFMAASARFVSGEHGALPDARWIGSLATKRRLTPRESQVLYWVSMGKTNEEVGQIVGAKPMTVKKHLEHIYDKLGVPNRTAAARLAAAGGVPA
jgi:DNA-binding CsgD family transcriptional regulator